MRMLVAFFDSIGGQLTHNHRATKMCQKVLASAAITTLVQDMHDVSALGLDGEGAHEGRAGMGQHTESS